MIIDHYHDRLVPARNTLSYLTYPAQLLAETPRNLTNWAVGNVSTYSRLLQENQQLGQANLELQGRLLRFDALAEENAQLRAQLGASLRVGERVTLAEMTNADFSPYKQFIWINKGARAGVTLDQPVIDAHGIIGQVIEVTPFRSSVMLITDAMHAIPVRVLRSGLLTVAKGTGRIDSLELPYLPRAADIRVGDLLISSGLGERYPADYPVARVTQIDIDSTGAPIVYAMPLARLAAVREVMLVWPIDQSILALSGNTEIGALQADSLLDSLTVPVIEPALVEPVAPEDE